MKPDSCYVCSEIIYSKRDINRTTYCLRHRMYHTKVDQIIRNIKKYFNNPISAAEYIGVVQRHFANSYEEN